MKTINFCLWLQGILNNLVTLSFCKELALPYNTSSFSLYVQRCLPGFVNVLRWIFAQNRQVMLDKLAFYIIFLGKCHWAAREKNDYGLAQWLYCFQVNREWTVINVSETSFEKNCNHTCNTENIGRKNRMLTATSNCHCSGPNQNLEAVHQKPQLLFPSCKKLEPRHHLKVDRNTMQYNMEGVRY